MSHDHAQPLNYCAHAIEDLRNDAAILRNVMPRTARVYDKLIGMLQESVKFILPNCCNLVDSSELKQAHMDLTRLPYPCVAFESPWETEHLVEQLGEFKQVQATKRIALCWQSGSNFAPVSGLNHFEVDFPDGGIFVVSIFWDSEIKHWCAAIGGTFIPYLNIVESVNVSNAPVSSIIAHNAALSAGLINSKSKQFQGYTFYLQPEICEKMLKEYGGDVDKLDAQIVLDTNDEVMAMVKACSVINCANVTTADIHASEASNKKRQKSGKQPFFSYKVLQLSDERRDYGNGEGGGTHASPRMHLRRGHLRRLDRKVIWVRPSMVNANSTAGTVMKDYSVISSNISTPN